MGKVVSLSQLTKISKTEKDNGKTIGLITGCFDAIHAGHVKLFRFARKNVDMVIVGVENDKNIKLSKGANRPLHTLKQRLLVLEELQSIDFIFPIRKVYNFDSKEVEEYTSYLYQQLKPTHLITNPLADQYHKEKKKRAEKLGIIFLPDRRKRESSSTRIIKPFE